MEAPLRYDVFFWYGIAVAVFLAFTVHRFQQFYAWLRIRSKASGNTGFVQTIQILGRPFNSIRAGLAPSLPANDIAGLPPLGTALCIAVYLGFVIALQYYPPVGGAAVMANRAGWIATAQIPLLIALINKTNIIALLTGVSYEHLNVLHHWVARAMLVMASLHFYYFYIKFGKTPGILKLGEDPNCVPTGLAAWAFLVWTNVSTLAPLRRLLPYEFFLIQHIVSFIAFIACMIVHIPVDATRGKVYVWLPLALYIADRCIRWTRMLERYRFGTSHARLEGYESSPDSLDDQMTKITVVDPKFKKWIPGSHVLVQMPSIAPGHSHPASIASTPASHNGAVVLLMKARGGFTRTIHRHAMEPTSLPVETQRSKSVNTSTSSTGRRGSSHPKHIDLTGTTKVILDGPHGTSCPSILASESMVFVAAGSGITLILPLLLSLSESAAHASNALPIRRVTVVWVNRDIGAVKIFLKEIARAARRLDRAGVSVRILFHATRPSQALLDYTASSADVSLPDPAHLTEQDDDAGSALGLTFSPRQAQSSTTKQPQVGSTRAQDAEDVVAEIHAAFIPPTSFRNASVVADMLTTGKEEGWRMMSITSVTATDIPRMKLGSPTIIVGSIGGSEKAFPSSKEVDVEKAAAVQHSRHTDDGGNVDLVIESGRPDLSSIVRTAVEAEKQDGAGETGVVVCGPTGVGVAVRNTVSALGLKGARIWVHVEGGR